MDNRLPVQEPHFPKPSPQALLRVALVALGYGGAALTVAGVAEVETAASAIWAASGIAMGALLVWGTWIWPGILLGALVADIHFLGFVPAAIVLAAARTAIALGCARAVTRICGPVDLGKPLDLAVLAGLGIFVPALLTAGCGIAALIAKGMVTADDALAPWTVWLAGDWAGAMIITPLALAWSAKPPSVWTGGRTVELLLAASVLIAAAGLSAMTGMAALFILFPLVLWITVRFSAAAGFTAVLTASVMVAWSLLNQEGHPLNVADGQLVDLDFLMGTLSLTALLLNAWVTALQRDKDQEIALRDEQLRQSEAQLRAAFESAPCGMALAVIKQGYMRVNTAMCAMLGYSEAEILSRTFRDLVHPEEIGDVLQVGDALTADDGKVLQRERRYMRKDGAEIWVLTSAAAIHEADRPARYSIIQYLDITARKHEEQARAALTERLQKLEEIGRIGGWSMGPGEAAATMTPGLCAILELSTPEEIAARAAHLASLWTQPAAAEDPNFGTALKASMAQGAALDTTIRITTAKGRPIWLHVRAEVMRRGAEIVGISGYARDVTLERQFKDKIAASQKMEAIGQLTAGIAHDFNNLLASISLNTDLIANDPATPAFQRERAEIVMKACDRGAGITRQLLAVARKQPLRPQRRDLAGLVHGAVRLIRSTLPMAIVIDVVAEAAPWVEIDQAQFDNAMLNLALNARDAMPGSGVLQIRVATSAIAAADGRLAAGTYALVSVEDNGVGMPEAVAARAFDPFYTTKPFGQGSGLGLSMVQGFVCQSGGDVQIHSSPGKGTTVDLLFPLVAAAAAAPAPAAPALRAAAGRRKRALLVEDMEDVREGCRLLLEQLGFQVVPVASGNAALDVIAVDAAFDVVLTDLDLPGGANGNRVAEAAAEANPRVMIITMTGYNEGRLKSLSEARTSARRVHLQKPFSRADLAAAVSRLSHEPADA